MKRIAYLVDSLSWVQAQRAKDLQPYLPDHELHVMLPSFATLSGPWDGFWVASWRILLAHPEMQDRLPTERTLLGVTSHYNIGGGLKPETCFRKGSDPDEEFQKAIAILQRFRLLTCNSKILFDRLQPHLPSVRLAQNGVDTKFFAPAFLEDWSFNPSRFSVTSICRRKTAKNLEAMERAVAHLSGLRAFTWTGVILRRGAVHVLDRNSVFETLLYQSHFYACTSWHEGTPNPALEAAACGLPLISTPVGNMPELVREGETGWFIEPTAESLIACVERLEHLEPWEYRRMSEAIRAEVEDKWTWAVRAEPYRRALEEVCEA